MPPVARRDEITQLIDHVLQGFPPSGSAGEPTADDSAAAECDQATGPVRATDGRWWQRPIAEERSEPLDAAA